MTQPELNLEDEKVLRTIEYSVESRMNLESEEQCTIIASPQMIKAIKIAIAKGQIFQLIYKRLIFQPNVIQEVEDPYSMTIIPDSLVEAAIQDQIKDYLATNEEVKEKIKVLNERMSKIPEEVLTRISFTPEEELTPEEKILKQEIQAAMIEVGMNVDLQFSNGKVSDAAIDSVFEKCAGTSTVVDLRGVITNEEKA